jgi:hypothetical protein
VESDQTQAPPAEAADASLTPAPEDGASSASPHQQTASISDSDMDAAIRQLAGSRSPLPPELDSQTAADAAADVTDAVQTDAASPDGVRPTGQVKPRLSKVELAEQKAAELAAENARLQQALDAANPPPPDASEEARAQYLADEQRYRDLLNVPDHELSSEDYTWREDQKDLRRKVPHLQQQYEAVLQRDLEAHQQAYARAWDGVKADLATTLALPGVTDEVKARLLKAPLSEQIRTHRLLERRIVESEQADEIARLRKDNERLQHEAMASTRAPVEGGRSGNPSLFDMDDWIRQSVGVRAR